MYEIVSSVFIFLKRWLQGTVTILAEALILNPVLVAILGDNSFSLMKLWDIFPENIPAYTQV